MGAADRFANLITAHSRSVIVVMVVASLLIGAGVTQLDQSSGLEQFEFESAEGDALEYIGDNFEVDDNQTNVQIVLRDQDNALSRDSFLDSLGLQQDVRDDPAVNQTLGANAFQDLGSIVATQAIANEQESELETRGERLSEERSELEGTAESLAVGINDTRELQSSYEDLNASYEAGEENDSEYAAQATAIEEDMAAVEANASDPLDDGQSAAYARLLADARSIQAEIVQTQMDAPGAETPQLEEEMQAVYDRIETEVLGSAFADLEEQGAALEEDERALAALDPTLPEQREQLESMDDDEVAMLVAEILGPEADRGAFAFVPTDFEPGETDTDARQVFAVQDTGGEEVAEGAAPDRVVDSQLRIADHVDERFGADGITFGMGIITDEIDRSMTDSLLIVLPLAFLFVIVVLTIAYRDPLDILLGLGGIGLVLLWTFGFIGWTGITFNQIMIAVPVLLVGLSIDYAIHVFMRHRERRAEADRRSRSAMTVVLLGLGAALVWVTITAMIGFLSNLVSPVQPIQDFGLASAFGIFATLLVFGILVPATKITLDEVLEARGIDRRKRAFGTGGGVLTDALGTGNRLAQRIPIGVVLIVLLLTAGGLYGAAQVDTEFNQEDFIADDPPTWMESLPEPFTPGEYTVKENLGFVNDRFLRQDTSTQTLIRGGVGADDTLERIRAGEEAAAEEDVVIELSDGDADVRSPLSSMQTVAATNESFAAVFAEADTTGNDVPDTNVTAVFDAYFEAAPEEAGRFLHRTDSGEYAATRMIISIEGDASAGAATDATRAIATAIDDGNSETVATGQLAVFHVIEDGLFDAVIESLIVTFLAVFGFLMVAYRIVHGSALLGAVTLTPIALTVAWILGTMYLLGIPFNVLTGTITSLTIGLGVAYNIHISERYRLEVDKGHNPVRAMERAVTGTGGALLGSAATTIGGFGVLIFAILPPLQQFGLITGITIFYAFLGSVFVLPSFLVLWTRYIAGD